jgi:hypothetical protein
MSVYIYCITHDYQYHSSITGRAFKNDWFNLTEDGIVTVYGTHYKGYAWDGCSPKIKFKDLFLGTLEGVLNNDTAHSKTYYASLIHDVFYQFRKDVRGFIKRKEVDRQLYDILRRDDFRFARFYYLAVRALGWCWWYR